MAISEKDQEKWQKLLNVQLTNEEWAYVGMLLGLLCKLKYAHQSFLSNCGPAAHLTLPVFEALCKAQNTQTTKAENTDFWPAVKAGINKLTEYYEKTTDSDAYIMAMCALLIVFDSSLWYIG